MIKGRRKSVKLPHETIQVQNCGMLYRRATTSSKFLAEIHPTLMIWFSFPANETILKWRQMIDGDRGGH
jgi:hypothetical protein